MAPTVNALPAGVPQVQVLPTVQLALTVPAFMIPAVRAVPGVLVFILTTRSTGRVAQEPPTIPLAVVPLAMLDEAETLPTLSCAVT